MNHKGKNDMNTSESPIIKNNKAQKTRIMNVQVIAHLALLLTAFFWGLSFISMKVILNAQIPPLTMAFVRFIIATVALFVMLKISEPAQRLHKEDILIMALGGFFGITIYFYFEATGVKFTTASNASMILAAIPIFTLFIEILYYRNRISLFKGLGVLLSVLGVYLIIQSSGNTPANPKLLLGNLLMLGACAAWVAYIMFSKKLKDRYSGLALTTYQTFFGTLFLLPFSLSEYQSWVTIPVNAWWNIIFLALCCSAAGYFMYQYALTKLDAITVSTYINLIPVVGVAGGIFFLQETVLPIQIIGGFIIIISVFIVSRTK
jgi:drug/metabolite transporter (DMT)-like permease